MSTSTPSLTPPRSAAFFLAAACAFALSGCSVFSKKSPTRPATESGGPSAPAHLELGRIISLQPESGTALVEFVPHARPPAGLAGRALLARKLDTLEVTARLVASPHQRGRILGVYVISGTPALDDEVVLNPEQ